MKHVEQYIEVLKKRAALPSVVHPSERVDCDLPGLKPKDVLSPERLMSLKSEYTRVLQFLQAQNKKRNAARGKAKKELTGSIDGARARLFELSLLIGTMTPEERTFGFPELMSDAQ